MLNIPKASTLVRCKIRRLDSLNSVNLQAKALCNNFARCTSFLEYILK